MLETLAQFLLFKALNRWSGSRLVLQLPGGGRRAFGPPGGQQYVVTVHHKRAFLRLATGGATGAGESYMDGDWNADNLPGLVAAALANTAAIPLDGPLSLGRRLIDLARHKRRSNTRDGSEDNIHAHYDLGNEFFRLFLDAETMAYSCAIFEPGDDLAAGQKRKFEAICQRLDLGPDDHVLEIGCGWGGFAIYAAATRSCRVTGITISREQQASARQRVAEADLGERIAIEYCDYRDISGKFDKVVSIEMFEAVGKEFWNEFFAVCARALRPGGKMLLQTIAIPDFGKANALRASGWISKYIFPGGILPAVVEIAESLAGAGQQLQIADEREIGPHYVQTLCEWRRRFQGALPQVRAIGFDDRFVRMWDFYLGSCAGAFESRSIRDVQLLLVRRPG